MSYIDKKLKVLVSAYACEPNKGSEPGVGWNWAKQIAKFAEAWVVTRANNKGIIEEELSQHPEHNLHFVYVDLPEWMRFWKEGQRGVHLYYLLWQFAAYLRALGLMRTVKFDIAHHVTFVNDWMPSFLAFLYIPFVWGPVGSNRPVPKRFAPEFKYYFIDRLKNLLITIDRIFNLFYILTFLRSERIILISENQCNIYPFSILSKDRFAIQQASAVDIAKKKTVRKNSNIAIYSAGSLIPIKGFHLAMKSFVELCPIEKNIRYIVSGEGSARMKLESFVHQLRLNSNVIFTGKLLHSAVLAFMQDADIFLFPSFEGGGMVVLEAMAAGLPVVCLDYGGPGEMVTDECGMKVKPITCEQTINDLADALRVLAIYPELRRKMGEAGRKRVAEHFTWKKKGEFIRKVYESVLSS